MIIQALSSQGRGIRVLAYLMAAALLASLAVSTSSHQPAAAVHNADPFDAGFIVSDEQFFDHDSMTVAEIQAFLDDVGPSNCNGCLREYIASSYDRDASSVRCPYALEGKDNISAAQMIYDVAQACRINPKTLLVILQKETSLVTLSSPGSWRYQRAMGYACPDSAPCDTSYYGLFIQLYSAAGQLRRYGSGGFTWYPVGQRSYVRYHPKSSCGVKAVTIQNRATAALYYYTPYTPNAAALANMYGTGDSCSSYGNRNFWRLWWDWFGSPTAAIVPEPEPSPSVTPSPSPSPSPTPSASPSPSAAPSPSPRVTPSPEPSATPSVTPSAEPSPTATASPSPSPSATPTEDPGEETGEPTFIRYTVKSGDTVWALAQKYGTTVAAIAKASGLENPALIYRGSILIIPLAGYEEPGESDTPDPSPSPETTPEPSPDPSPSASPTETEAPEETEDPATEDEPQEDITYTVVRGDTLSAIAARFGSTVAAIAERNGITNVNLIFVNQKIVIPGSGAASSDSESAGDSGSASADTTTTYTVVRGDTLWAIARRYDVTVSQLVEWNDIDNPRLIFAGQKIRIQTS